MKGQDGAPRPTLFVGSSTEGLPVARAVADALGADAEVTVWNESVFRVGLTFIESVGATLADYDFGVLILSPDDHLDSRGRFVEVPRDNVVLELGLFLGRMGRERVFVACPDDGSVKLPSDLAGLTVAQWDARRRDGNLIAAVRPVASVFRAVLRQRARAGNSRHRESFQPHAFGRDVQPLNSHEPRGDSDAAMSLASSYVTIARVHSQNLNDRFFDLQKARDAIAEVKRLVQKMDWLPAKPGWHNAEAQVEYAEYEAMRKAGEVSAVILTAKLKHARLDAEIAVRCNPYNKHARELLVKIEAAMAEADGVSA